MTEKLSDGDLTWYELKLSSGVSCEVEPHDLRALLAAARRCAELEKTCGELDSARLRVENNAVAKIEQMRHKRQDAEDQRAAALERCAELEATIAVMREDTGKLIKALAEKPRKGGNR